MTRDELEACMVGGRVFLHPDEFEPILRYAAHSHTLVEIGTGYGGSAVLMLSSSPTSIVHSIDPFMPDTHGTWQSSSQKARYHVSNACRALRLDVSRWILHERTSVQAAEEVKRSELRPDLVFVDGDHSYAAVRLDVESWYPALRIGGVMLLHDSRRLPGMPDQEFHQGWPGPTQVAVELRSDPRFELIEEVHSLTIWKRKN